MHFKDIKKHKNTYLISEVAQAHEGSLNLAFSYMNEIKKSGYDAVKFQIHYHEFETTLDDKFRNNKNIFYKNRYTYWKDMEFNEKDWINLSKQSKIMELDFICSIFSFEAIKTIKKLPHLTAIKISSGEMFNRKLIKEISKLKKPIIISMGMAEKKDIKNLVIYLKKNNIKNAYFLHCTSKYPTKLNEIRFNNISFLKKDLNIDVGLSDHSSNKYVIMAAISKKIPIIETHITYNKNILSPDSLSSLTPDEMQEISNFRDTFHKISTQKVKFSLDDELKKNKILFSKSLCLNKNLKKGNTITMNDITEKKPGSGIPLKDIKKIINLKLKKNVNKDTLLKWSDLSKK